MTVRVPSALLERSPQILAPIAGLEYITDDTPGIVRQRRGKGFTYRRQTPTTRSTVSDRERQRLEALAVPPAWIDVWMSPSSNGYLQASGYDDAGRKQYRYHDDFRALCERRKFDRLPYFAKALVKIRKAVHESVSEPVGSRAHAAGAAVGLIDTCLLRVGNDVSAASGHYGATTLTVDHVVDDGFLVLEYVAKSGKTRTVTVEDDDLADILVELAHGADNELFWFTDDSGDRRRATASDINRFIVNHVGPAFSAKDFRTWGGSRKALQARSTGAALLDAIDAAADELGNTRAVARNSYIHPAVLEAPDTTIKKLWASSRSSNWMDRSDRTLAKLLTTHRVPQ